MTKRNTLNFEQKVTCDKYVKEHSEELCATRPHSEDLAKTMGKELGFKISPSNVKGILRYAGISYTARKRFYRKRAPKVTPVLLPLTMIVVELAEMAGLTIPPELTDFIAEQEVTNGNEGKDDL